MDLEGERARSSSTAELCLTAKSDKTVLVEPCLDEDDEGAERQVWTREGNLFKVQIAGQVTCLTPGKDGLNSPDIVARHIPCDAAVLQQQWLVLAPLRNGRPLQLSEQDFDPLDPGDVDAAIARLQEDAEGGVCLDESVVLQACDRLDSRMLWAYDADGRLQPSDLARRPLSLHPGFPDEVSTDFGLNTKQIALQNVTELLFDRTLAGVGFVKFNRKDNGDLLFPGAKAEGESLFTGAIDPDPSSELDDFYFWRRLAEGKFAP
ncbi:hypothetical protein OV079_23980 [Nannocystis pusilla]|uniref:Uncharacterized protein n=1 Tax=Nannocystis pusilla TaxID=889268 RepID=A0A9X3J021_9BACT|nr:hypothetical protein [Nannocystis pusilla]MCY1008563.1 hypothetical protein [Nannocystis pusilla]